MIPVHRTTGRTDKMLQFGGGNFLRGFVDWIIDIYNEKTDNKIEVIIVKPTERGDYAQWRNQQGIYHVLTRGVRKGQLVDECRRITCVTSFIHPYQEWHRYLDSAQDEDIRYITSNTTEAGIRFSPLDRIDDTPPTEFPAKVTLWLYHRYLHFKGDRSKGCIILPTELLIDNGTALLSTIGQYIEHWSLPKDFHQWLHQANTFCNTLVDRIVPGIAPSELPAVWERLGTQDAMVTQGEPYHFWAIEAPPRVRQQLPLDQIGLNIVYADHIAPYRQLKVRILNGAHTALVPVAYLYGLTTVKDSLEDRVIGRYLRKAIFDEILPTLDIPISELEQFAYDVIDRFKNPFIDHLLIKIALNGISKFKTRVLPTILNNIEQYDSIPTCLTFSWACLIYFYKGEYNGYPIELKDDEALIASFQSLWEDKENGAITIADMVGDILSWQEAWGQDLSHLSPLQKRLTQQVTTIEQHGLAHAIEQVLKKMK